ncbi:hypothetical protein HDV00_005047 [Rhizophlyctis rosea]|nr:hypothetical protein HDV00_005047 [Rhizophlyctis rosea]
MAGTSKFPDDLHSIFEDPRHEDAVPKHLHPEQYAQQMINEYKAAKIDPSRVFPQCFLINHIYYWIKHKPKFVKQAVFLKVFVKDPFSYVHATVRLAELKKDGFEIVAPAFFALTKVAKDSKIIIPSK